MYRLCPPSRIPDDMTFAAAAMLEPLSAAMSGIRAVSFRLGCGVLICGAGPLVSQQSLLLECLGHIQSLLRTWTRADRLSQKRSYLAALPIKSIALWMQWKRKSHLYIAGSEEYWGSEVFPECRGWKVACIAVYTTRRGGRWRSSGSTRRSWINTRSCTCLWQR
jgi:L-iditol 2-dehydrogenase